jgi:4-aminobutyrate aminotransferase-like enzyme
VGPPVEGFPTSLPQPRRARLRSEERARRLSRVTRTLPPEIRTEVPGPRSRALAARLGRVESRDTTCLAPPPIFWERAEGANVWDVDGNRYVDLGAGFGVAAAGHAHPRVVTALSQQAARLLHAMGDFQPASVKVELLEALTARFPGGATARGVLGSSGSDAVEAALETALLASGRPGVVAFAGGYHGLALGARDATWRPFFREPFAARLPGHTAFARFGDVSDVRRVARALESPVGAVLVEPVQGRGGVRVPPPGFLRALRELCDHEGWLLIADEIYTGCGRTGRMFACEHEGVVPDLLCVGKALGSGMPISACLGRTEVMDAWPASAGEALRTQTFLGHPPACAAALASLAVIDDEKLAVRAAELGERARIFLDEAAQGAGRAVACRGLGLMIGIECDGPETATAATAAALAAGYVVLPAGDDGRVISVTPPLGIGAEALLAGLAAVLEALA